MSKTGHITNLHEHFSNIAEVYRDLRTTDEAPIRFIRDQLAGLASIRAADVGCGTRRYDLLLFRYLPNLHLTCVDVNPEMLEQLSAYLAANGIRDFETVASGVEELEFEDGSLDCVFTFNAVHHFDFHAFVGKARDATRQSGGVFIYTRTPRQNAETIWGRYFPDFLDKETRLHRLADMKGWVDATDGVRLVTVKRFRYSRVASLDRLLAQARSKHYSTFCLYSPREFETALEDFEDNIRHQFDDPGKVEWHDENILLQIGRHRSGGPVRRCPGDAQAGTQGSVHRQRAGGPRSPERR